ncbi:hypothetical protein P7K49_032530 [Saguinus oedipus]|uniref:Uncharacterized protein n=1 Tax=Saguinus oedipus TaxID=9490 RepID=A0ABQ9TYI3_SAGOE|nr:hypothetical protein P7K49_032530 [Saguinus oedipus]
MWCPCTNGGGQGPAQGNLALGTGCESSIPGTQLGHPPAQPGPQGQLSSREIYSSHGLQAMEETTGVSRHSPSCCPRGQLQSAPVSARLPGDQRGLWYYCLRGLWAKRSQQVPWGHLVAPCGVCRPQATTAGLSPPSSTRSQLGVWGEQQRESGGQEAAQDPAQQDIKAPEQWLEVPEGSLGAGLPTLQGQQTCVRGADTREGGTGGTEREPPPFMPLWLARSL